MVLPIKSNQKEKRSLKNIIIRSSQLEMIKANSNNCKKNRKLPDKLLEIRVILMWLRDARVSWIAKVWRDARTTMVSLSSLVMFHKTVKRNYSLVNPFRIQSCKHITITTMTSVECKCSTKVVHLTIS